MNGFDAMYAGVKNQAKSNTKLVALMFLISNEGNQLAQDAIKVVFL